MAPEYKWSEVMPKSIGLWELRCGENGNIAERIAVTNRGAHLFAHCADIGEYPLKAYHDGLTLPEWRKLA